VFGSLLVPVVVEAAGRKCGERGAQGAGARRDDGDWGGGAKRSGGERAGLDGAGIGDGVVHAGVVDAVESLEALVGVGGERVGAVGGCVLNTDFGGA
jgi:hypothetical protein